MGGAETWNFNAGLSPGGGVARVSVNHAANAGEGLIEGDVGGEIGRWAEIAGVLEDVAFEVGEDEIGGDEFIVRDAAGFDDDAIAGGVVTAGIAEGEDD